MNILGWLLCIFVIPIILAGHLLVLPLALLMPIAPLYAYILSQIQSVLFHTVLWYFNTILGIKVILTGDRFHNSDQRRLVISNHPTTIDWLWLWYIQHQQDSISNLRYVMNADGVSFKTIPLVGQLMEFICHLFLVKNDKNAIDRCARAIRRTILYYKKVKFRSTLVLYPEGATLEDDNIERSQRYAKNSGVEPLQRLLLPRERGFTEVVKYADIDCIYDLTVGIPEFDDGKGGDPIKFHLGKIFTQNHYPSRVHIHIRRYPVVRSADLSTSSNVLIDDEPIDVLTEEEHTEHVHDAVTICQLTDKEENKSAWLRSLYRDKDKLLEDYYKEEDYSKRIFSPNGRPIIFSWIKTFKLWISIVFWLVLFVFVIIACTLIPHFGKIWATYILISVALSVLQKFKILKFGVERLVMAMACVSVQSCSR